VRHHKVSGQIHLNGDFPNLRRLDGTYSDLVARMRSVGRSAHDEHAPADAFHLPRSLRDVGSWKLGGGE
jgi:hypothetical protein